MGEIRKNGPMVAEFTLFEDFYNYTGGIYKHKTGKLLGYYYAKIVGWSQDYTGLGYWVAAASFGQNWGKRI
jgi:cathepsin B